MGETPSETEHADTIVVGGGTAGAVVAARLAEAGEQVLLLEAGPDYGALDESRWPSELLDATRIPASHQWGYDSGTTYPERVVQFPRARVIGGCSAHNGCAAIWGSRLDYDGWAAAGNDGWSTDELHPLFKEVNRKLRVRIFDREELTPFQGGLLDASPSVGIPIVADLNDLDENLGAGANPANIVDRVRWSTALGYLDGARASGALSVLGEALVDRVLLEGGRVRGVIAIVAGRPQRIGAGRVVLAGGTYESPAILQRSGVGDPDRLTQIGIAPVHRAAVGRNLHDHPCVQIEFVGTEELNRTTDGFGRDHWVPDEQVIVKARSQQPEEAFDLHIFAYSPQDPTMRGSRSWILNIACLTPRSRGELTVRDADPTSLPLIDHRYVSDADGHDLEALVDGVELALAMAAEPAYRKLLGKETRLGADTSRQAIRDHVLRTCEHYYHPVGTCRMGPDPDGGAVVGPSGAVWGLDGLYVADSSIIPVIPRANTNIPAAVVGERVARSLVDGG